MKCLSCYFSYQTSKNPSKNTKEGLLHHTVVEISHSFPVNRNSSMVVLPSDLLVWPPRARETIDEPRLLIGCRGASVTSLHPQIRDSSWKFLRERVSVVCKLTVREDYSFTRSTDLSVLWFSTAALGLYFSHSLLASSLTSGENSKSESWPNLTRDQPTGYLRRLKTR